jgi:hypothetical protein
MPDQPPEVNARKFHQEAASIQPDGRSFIPPLKAPESGGFQRSPAGG